jgi:hypothetical protein
VRLAEDAEETTLDVIGDKLADLILGRLRPWPPADLEIAAAGVMSGSSPLAEVVIRSTGTGWPGSRP